MLAGKRIDRSTIDRECRRRQCQLHDRASDLRIGRDSNPDGARVFTWTEGLQNAVDIAAILFADAQRVRGAVRNVAERGRKSSAIDEQPSTSAGGYSGKIQSRYSRMPRKSIDACAARNFESGRSTPPDFYKLMWF